jgi:hypothetical protein
MIGVQIRQNVSALSDAGDAAIEHCMSLVAQELFGNVRRESPVDTGRLASSFVSEKRDRLTHTVFTNVEYALAVHEGTRPRTITPINARALFWPGAAHPFASVRHPGTRANAYGTRAIDRTRQRLDEFAQIAVDKAVAEMEAPK